MFNITIFFFTICILLLWFPDTFLLCSLICILLLILLTCFIICCLLNIELILFFLCQICQRECFWKPLSCSLIRDKNFLLVIWDILFYVPLCNVFLALLYEYFFCSFSFPLCLQECWPSSSQACRIWKPVILCPGP